VGLHVACPGSYDPPHNGHLDVVARAARIADQVTVAVLVNPRKRGLLPVHDRVALLETVTVELPNVTVETFDGLLVDFCRSRGIAAVVKGLRGAGDFPYEAQMAQMNAHVAGVETMFVVTDPRYAFVSSSLVKEVAAYGGDVQDLVPPAVHPVLLSRLAERADHEAVPASTDRDPDATRP
jgi:pantetheine-phosphate adenylyltransferase